MAKLRITGDGRLRGLGDGLVRAVDQSGPAHSAVTASTAATFAVSASPSAVASIAATVVMAFALSASPTAFAEIAGASSPVTFAVGAPADGLAQATADAALVFNLSASPSSSGGASTSFAFDLSASPSGMANATAHAALTFDAYAFPAGLSPAAGNAAVVFSAAAIPGGRAELTSLLPIAFDASAQPSGTGSLAAATALTWDATASPSAFARKTGNSNLVFEVTAKPSALVDVSGATAVTFATSVQPTALVLGAGSTSLAFASTASPSINQAAFFRSKWLDVYAARQIVLNAVDANNRLIAKRADAAGVANASAIIVTNTRVDTTDGNLLAEANRITSLDSRVTSAEGVNTSQATALNSLDTRVTSAEGVNTSQASSITSLNSSVATKTTAFVQPEPPTTTGRVVGDLWIDSDDNNQLYGWGGTAWVPRNLAGGITVFAQTTQPPITGRRLGDLWFDTGNNNRQWRWDGLNWVDISDARILQNASAITSLTTRVTSAEGVNTSQASSITSLGSRVTDTETGVTNNASATTALTTRVTSTEGRATTLEARWNVTLDVNGYVSGLTSVNNGTIATFTVLADQFRIITPGAIPSIPFEIVGGVTYIKNAVIQNVGVGKLTTGTLNADMQIGTGRIVFDNGVFMKVSGLGFGTAGQFLEWSGPSRALNLCDEASAIQFLKTNGAAYFGGTLSSGVFKNAATSSQVSVTAQVETGVFGTNGNAKTVVCSFNYENSGVTSNNIANHQTTATVVLERSYAGGAWTQIGTINATGNYSSFWEAELSVFIFNVSCGGSITVTDSQAGTGNFNYRARITAGTGSWPYTANNASVGTQRLTIISSEG